MPQYRRVNIKGGTYFLTLVTYRRQRLFSLPHVRDLLHEAIDYTQQNHPFYILAFCFLPDHVHFLWQLPENDADYSLRISLIKRRFSKEYIAKFGLPYTKNSSRLKRREVTIWQRRFWEHYIRDEEDLNRHIDYIHYNPVKHELVDRVLDWEDSSFSDYVKAGYYDVNWGANQKFNTQKHSFGE